MVSGPRWTPREMAVEVGRRGKFEKADAQFSSLGVRCRHPIETLNYWLKINESLFSLLHDAEITGLRAVVL